MTPSLDDFLHLGVALLIGLLIGLDRERAEARKSRDLFAGVRTFPLIALAGAVPASQLSSWGVVPLAASLLAVMALVSVAYYRSSTAESIGATTETAALVTFLLGALAGSGHVLLASAVGIVVALLLNAKPRLEGFSRALSERELDAVLELGVISCIVLPLLPNRGMGPWQVWNPFEIWLVVVAVSALSFAGFVAMRLFGRTRGLLLSGLIGALVSSTAVTVAMASRSRQHPSDAGLAAAAATLASVVMGWRVLVLVAVAGGLVLIPRLLPSVVMMTLAGVVVSLWLWRGEKRAQPEGEPPEIANPFRLVQAVSFGLIYAVVLVVMPASREYVGESGTYVTAALASLLDVDAVTIAFARKVNESIPLGEAAAGVLLAVIVNTLFKLCVAVVMGDGKFRRGVVLGLGTMAVVGVLAGVGVLLALS